MEYSEETYGERVADVYDDWFSSHDAEAIDLLAQLAGDGRALELGIGTGRFALPLLARGVEVHGIDVSPSMIARLRSKPGGDRVTVVQDNFVDVPVAGEFNLIYVVFNTFFAVWSQDEQISCFANIADRLVSGGAFVMEAFVPDLSRFERGQRVEVRHLDGDSALLMLSRHHPATQRVDSMLIRISNDRVRTWPVPIRYSYPTELDLMAGHAGLRLEQRWRGWACEPYTDSSVKHVSVYAASEPA